MDTTDTGGGQRLSDPSSLSTQALLREIFLLREWITTKFDGVDITFDGMKEALKLLQAFADKSPTTAAVDQAVRELRTLTETKFKAADSLRDANDRRQNDLSKMRDEYEARIKTIMENCEHRIADILTKSADNVQIMRTGQIGDLAKKVSVLEEARYEERGKTSVADPALANVLKEMATTLGTLKGSSDAGRNQVIAWVVAGVMAVIAAWKIFQP